MYGSGIELPRVAFSTLNYSEIQVGGYFIGFDLDNSGKLSKIDSSGTITVLEGVSGSPIDITYSELYQKIVNSQLVAGVKYRLLDYKSVNFLNGIQIANNNVTPIDPSFNPRQVHTGQEEVLILEAISTHELNPVCVSETYPSDVLQFQAYTNKIGVDFSIYNGSTLPDSTIVSGFDLQWDGTNVYFNMPEGYPALFGHYFYLYCEFSGSSYYQDGVYEPLTPIISMCQYPFTSDDPSFGYLKGMSRLSVVDDGMKVILLDLTEADYNNYDSNTLFVQTVYAIADAYGCVTRRHDTEKQVNVPFDFRGRVYRRYEVDLSFLNTSLGVGYWGQGDNYLGQGTTGNYKDLKCFGNENQPYYNINWAGLGGYDMYFYAGYCDNNVCCSFYEMSVSEYTYNNTIYVWCYSNTLGKEFINNTINGSFQYNVINESFQDNLIGTNFSNNEISSRFQYNSTNGVFSTNMIGLSFLLNKVGDNFNNNETSIFFTGNVIGTDFSYNRVGQQFSSNVIDNQFKYNTVGPYFQSNSILSGFQKNVTHVLFKENILGAGVSNNVFSNQFQSNTTVNYFQRNTIEYDIIGIDFSLATRVYANYNCTLLKHSAGALILTYHDGTGYATDLITS